MKFIRRSVRLLMIISVVIIGLSFLLREKQEPLTSHEVEAAIHIPYHIENIPVSNKRPGKTRKIEYIVIHNTANPNSTAQNERDYLTNPGNGSSTSFNLVVDQNEIIEAIPPNEVAFHAGTREGNQKGIGIEICESGNYVQNQANAAKLTAFLMKKYHLSIDQVKTHHDFSGKDCPRLILDHWEDFKKQVQKNYDNMK